MMLRIVYFARVREAVGVDGETREVLAEMTIASLIDQMAAENARYADAFADRSKLRFALDQQMVREGAPLGGASELAIFPPVTGG
jgi:molybdopterin synthase sulfur carrier subunit